MILLTIPIHLMMLKLSWSHTFRT